MLPFLQSPSGRLLLSLIAGIAALLVCWVALGFAAEPTGVISPEIRWAAWTATAAASALATFRLFAGPLTSGQDADRATGTIARAWFAVFAVVLLVTRGTVHVEQFQSTRQQKLCANAALMLKATPEQLRALGLRCAP